MPKFSNFYTSKLSYTFGRWNKQFDTKAGWFNDFSIFQFDTTGTGTLPRLNTVIASSYAIRRITRLAIFAFFRSKIMMSHRARALRIFQEYTKATLYSFRLYLQFRLTIVHSFNDTSLVHEHTRNSHIFSRELELYIVLATK